MKRLFQLTVALLLAQAILLVCRAVFFSSYAPAWFWTTLSVLLALTGTLVVYCTVQRAQRLRRVKDSVKKLTLMGSVLFHLGLVTVILAGFYFTLYQYKALLYLTEGQTLADRPQNYALLSQGPINAGDFDRVALTLLDVKVDFYDPNLVEQLTARVMVEEIHTGHHRAVDTAINRPFYFLSRKASIYKFGFAPLLKISSSEGELLWQGFVNLDLVGGKADLFKWPISGKQVRVQATVDQGLGLTFFISDQAGTDLVIKPGDPPSPFLGTSLEIPDYRYWLGFVITNTRGTRSILVGLVFSIIGIVLRNLFVFTTDKSVREGITVKT